MNFSDDIDNAMTDLFETAGDLAILTRVVGGDTSCHVDVIKDVEFQPDGFSSVVSAGQVMIELFLSEITTEPSRGDTITVGSDTYTVDSIYGNDGRFCRVIVT